MWPAGAAGQLLASRAVVPPRVPAAASHHRAHRPMLRLSAAILVPARAAAHEMLSRARSRTSTKYGCISVICCQYDYGRDEVVHTRKRTTHCYLLLLYL
jgi:hypothetical protein